ncbi:MAG: HD domain-containing protein [Planctomycetaceae bacterium]|nr:HD domain-containing protein [Planctomycetaceae bacterium]
MNDPQYSTDQIIDEVLRLFRERGDSEYGGEAVTQAEHALQAADLALEDGAESTLVVAALLHDVGHLLHRLPDDAPDYGVDDEHEELGGRWLEKRFSPAVIEPVRLHVAAKRYMCARDPAYFELLSEPSRLSLKLQGGPMNANEVNEFEKNPYHEDAVRLRRWDDEAKIVDKVTTPLEGFVDHLRRALAERTDAS